MLYWPLAFVAAVWGEPSWGLAVTLTLPREPVLEVTVPVMVPAAAAAAAAVRSVLWLLEQAAKTMAVPQMRVRICSISVGYTSTRHRTTLVYGMTLSSGSR